MSNEQAEQEYYWHILCEFKAMGMYFGPDKIKRDLMRIKFTDEGPVIEDEKPVIVLPE